MPIPKPNTGEKEKEYMERCMKAQSSENKPNDQKLAICYNNFREEKTKEIKKSLPKLNNIIKKALNLNATTSYDYNHWHQYSIDSNGNGETIETYPDSFVIHNHKISNFSVIENEGHKHNIDKL